MLFLYHALFYPLFLFAAALFLYALLFAYYLITLFLSLRFVLCLRFFIHAFLCLTFFILFTPVFCFRFYISTFLSLIFAFTPVYFVYCFYLPSVFYPLSCFYLCLLSHISFIYTSNIASKKFLPGNYIQVILFPRGNIYVIFYKSKNICVRFVIQEIFASDYFVFIHY